MVNISRESGTGFIATLRESFTGWFTTRLSMVAELAPVGPAQLAAKQANMWQVAHMAPSRAARLDGQDL